MGGLWVKLQIKSFGKVLFFEKKTEGRFLAIEISFFAFIH